MSGQLEGKIALVTGASRGIGRATAVLLARQGALVVITGRSEVDLAGTSDEITATGGKCLIVSGEITDESFVLGLFQEIELRYGGLDILINNAGVAPFASVDEMPVTTLRLCLEVNVVALFHCMQQAVHLMKKRGEGKILNIGSVRSHWSEGGDSGAYNASKYAVRALTESVARELQMAGNRISVGLLCPGIVDTGLTNPNRHDQPEWLRPETIAAAILHAVTAPANVNVFDTIVFPSSQRPW